MATGIMLSHMTGRIYWANPANPGKKIDITDDCIKAVAEHMKHLCIKDNDADGWEFSFDDGVLSWDKKTNS
jgi:hypothetical protein